MPMKELKTNTQNELIIDRILHARRYSLTLDKKLCKSCEICQITCPREAIKVTTTQKKDGQKAKPPTIDISAQKCSYCGICEPICPFGALQVRVNGEHIVPVVEKESFPNLIREIEVDTSKCDVGCVDCEKACPLNLIKVKILTPDGQEIIAEDVESRTSQNDFKVRVDIKKDLCPGCRLCEMKCPQNAVHVRKTFHGVLSINLEKCPQGCQDCLDMCPIPGALFLNNNGKVRPNDTFCVFCGTCKLVCPVQGALEVDRKSIYHTPVSSGAWNKVLEKLTSANEYSKEAKLKGWMKAQQAVEKRLMSPKESQT
jgi:formate hydrogenlyase subunit 6/NADH:ubiquinone oxidoreductase subunit I